MRIGSDVAGLMLSTREIMKIMTTVLFVIGGGVIGTNIARAIKRRFAVSSVTVIEKETAQELKKYPRTHLIHQASSLWEDIRSESFQKWGELGIRAQLIDMKQEKWKWIVSSKETIGRCMFLMLVPPASPVPCLFPSMCVSGFRPGLGRLEVRLLKILVNKSEFIAVQKSI